MKKWSLTNVIELNLSKIYTQVSFYMEVLLRTVLRIILFEFVHWDMDVGKSKFKKSQHH